MAARIEDVKAAGIAVDIDRLAADGFASISEDDRYRLKTQGVCAQRHVGVFMIRIRVPGGKATPAQLVRVAELAERYGQASLHVTTRGGLELHHVRIEDVPAVQAGLAEVGLTTKGSCGDTLRNVIACAHAGTFAGEVLPPAPFVRRLHDRIVAISDATNLSRKMNVAFACSPQCDDHVATSDIGFVATPADDGQPTFTVWGAGGLGATPRLAIELRRGVAQSDLLPAFDALVALGVKYGDRSARAKAKIKLLVDAWGAERVRTVFDDEFAAARAAYAESPESPVASDEALPATEAFAAGAMRPEIRDGPGAATGAAAPPPAVAAAPPPSGIAARAVAQKQPGLFTIPALVPMGELPCVAARALAAAAETYGDGVVHLTPDQNAELQGVREADVPAAIAAIEGVALRTAGRGGITDVVSCVGLEYCPLAVAHSMTMGEELALALAPYRDDPRFADFRIHVSGCPHSCAKHQVADIGLSGAVLNANGQRIEAYQLYIGGDARERRLGTMAPTRIVRAGVLPAVTAMLALYDTHAHPGERFSQAVARLGPAAFFTTAGLAADPIQTAV